MTDTVPTPAPQELIARARAAADRAYCPYSEFPVGAALLCQDGTIVTGCNVENAAYGLTLCAERVALGAAISRGIRIFTALAIVGGADRPAYPCGACRQAYAEFCSGTFSIFVASLSNIDTWEEFTLGNLLPQGFSL